MTERAAACCVEASVVGELGEPEDDASPRFVQVYGDSKRCLFIGGRRVADLRPSGQAWRVRVFFPDSDTVYRSTLVLNEAVAEIVALDMAEQLVDLRQWQETPE